MSFLTLFQIRLTFIYLWLLFHLFVVLFLMLQQTHINVLCVRHWVGSQEHSKETETECANKQFAYNMVHGIHLRSRHRMSERVFLEGYS